MTLISGCRLTARQFRSAPLVAAALVGLALGPALARADGDPASDVLASQTAFVPADAGASTVQLARVAAVLEGAARSGYAIRVAVIPSATDLGSVTALWRQPANYARFLRSRERSDHRDRAARHGLWAPPVAREPRCGGKGRGGTEIRLRRRLSDVAGRVRLRTRPDRSRMGRQPAGAAAQPRQARDSHLTVVDAVVGENIFRVEVSRQC